MMPQSLGDSSPEEFRKQLHVLRNFTFGSGRLVFAILMGYAGGLLPAMRAARMPIVRATRGG